MKDLQKLFEECLNEVQAVGIIPGKITEIKPNARYTSRWGTCRPHKKGKGYVYSIEISTRLLEDNVSDVAAKNTIIHEILHTCMGTYSHNSEWKHLAYIINSNYPQYNIKRTTSCEEKGIEKPEKEYKYILKCVKCGNEFNYMKMAWAVQNYELCNCKCGGKLNRIK